MKTMANTWLGPAAALLIPLLLSASAPAQAGAATDVLARAKALLDNADARSALALLEKASRTANDDDRSRADILRLKGYTLVLLRRNAEAEATFRELLELKKGDEYGTLELAKRLHDRGAFSEARRLYRSVLERNPDNEAARDGLKRLERAEREERAVAERVRSGERALYWLAGLTVVVLVGFGLLLRYLLFKRVPAQ
jgi:tetratricopeptide (TPR) repeat protein